MIDRCENPRQKAYRYYGARGIKVCERWHKFEAFIEDMGRRPSKDLEIDRINPNGDYEPQNCRWADRVTQRHNRAQNNIRLTPELVLAIRSDKAVGMKQGAVAVKYGLSVHNVKDAMRGRSWKYADASA